MKNKAKLNSRLVLALWLGLLSLVAAAQDRLKTMPGYDQYQKMSREIPGSVKSGAVQAAWKDGGKALEFRKDGKVMRYDLATKQLAEATPSANGEAPNAVACGAAIADCSKPASRTPAKPPNAATTWL